MTRIDQALWGAVIGGSAINAVLIVELTSLMVRACVLPWPTYAC